jgi:adenylate kinase family enzyme
MARKLSRQLSLPYLDLDTIAWQAPAVRKPTAASIAEIDRFIKTHDGWVIEGCYGDLIEAALPWCTDLYFLNPGMAACVRNSKNRPWEPHKFATAEGQAENLSVLIDWIRRYETRDDEFSLARHRTIFDGFHGKKVELGDEPLTP